MLESLWILAAALPVFGNVDHVNADLHLSSRDDNSTGDGLFPMPLCNGIKIEDATIEELQRWMTLGQLSSQDLVSCYVARIEQTNPYVSSIQTKVVAYT